MIVTQCGGEMPETTVGEDALDVYDAGSRSLNDSGAFSVRVLALSVLCTLLTSMDLVPIAGKTVTEALVAACGGFQPSELRHWFVLLAYYCLFSAFVQSMRRGKRVSVPYVLVSLILSFFMVEGQRFVKPNGIDLFVTCIPEVLLCLVVMAGWFVVFLAALLLLDEWLDDVAPTATHEDLMHAGMVKRFVSDHSFGCIVALLLLILIPVSLLAYPGQFMGDTLGIIAQGFRLQNYHPYWSPDDSGMKLGNHHPVTYTLLLHYCIVAGKALFGAYNRGLYVSVLLQLIASVCAFAYCITALQRAGVIRLGTAFVLALFYGLNSQVQLYLVLLSKDALYSAALLFFLTTAFELCCGERRKPTIALFAFSAVCCVLFRNDGIYVLVPTLVALLTQRGSRRATAVLLPAIVVFWLVFGKVILPFAGVIPGSKREMLSIPFQQTARYLVEHPDDVTDSERAAIDGVLIFDRVAESYDPNISDPVKSLYREDATSDDMRRYFSAWKDMFVKHPATYVHAVLHNKYEYFYPDALIGRSFTFGWSADRMKATNQVCEKLGTDFHHPKRLESQRILYEGICDATISMPLVGALLSAPMYLWLFLFLLAFTLRRRNWDALVFLVPIFMIFLINLAGPTNGGYFRYTYPVMLYMPIALATTLCLKNDR